MGAREKSAISLEEPWDSNTLGNKTEKKTDQPQTEEQRGTRACAPHSQRIDLQSPERTRGWLSYGLRSI